MPDGLERWLERIEGKVDMVLRSTAELEAKHAEHGRRLGVIEQRCESRADATGREVALQLRDARESRTHWVRYAVATAVGVVLTTLGAVIQAAIGG